MDASVEHTQKKLCVSILTPRKRREILVLSFLYTGRSISHAKVPASPFCPRLSNTGSYEHEDRRPGEWSTPTPKQQYGT